jgi:hypothetical protein
MMSATTIRVRAVAVFVVRLDLAALGFEGVQPLATGLPSYILRRCGGFAIRGGC